MSKSMGNYWQERDRLRHLIVGMCLVAVIAVALVLVLAISARHSAPDPTNVPLVSSEDRIYYLAVFMAAALTGIAWYVIDPDRAVHYRITYAEVVTEKRTELGKTGWMSPAIVVFSAGIFLVMFHRWLWIAALLLTTILAIAGFAVARYAVINRIDFRQFQPRTALQIMIPFLAFLCYSAAYLLKAPLRYTVPVAGMLTVLLMIQYLAGIQDIWPASAGWTAVIALIVVESVWAMNYWNTEWYIGGSILVIMLFAFGSLAVSHLTGNFTALVVYTRLAFAIPAFLFLALLS